MEAGLLQLESSPDAEAINQVFRAAHSIKGSGGSLGLTDIASFAHFTETLLDEMREGKRKPSAEITEVLLESVDCLREMLDAKRDGLPLDRARVEQTTQRLKDLLATSTEHEVSAPAAAPESGSKNERDGLAAQGSWHIAFRPYLHLFRTGNDPARLFRELAKLGALQVEAHYDRLPELAEMDPENCYMSWDLELTGAASEAEIREVFEWVEGDCELLMEQRQAAEPMVQAERPVQASVAESAAVAKVDTVTMNTTAVAKPSKSGDGGSKVGKSGDAGSKVSKSGDAGSIRVGTDKVDNIINLVGELIITQSMLSCCGENFDMSMAGKLRDGLALLARNTRELQEAVLKIRMLPISVAFNRVPRVVHDLSHKLDKKITLQVTGEQTELDKTVLEKISDPLVHLVRNSLDHGIEKPEARRAAGKPETGTLRLHAAHEGGSVLIEIGDDGAGLNTERILAKARAKGLVGQGELSDEQINELIFAPGFSTAEEVTDISGRGVGMDVVRRNIAELGGTVEIRTRRGEGTTFAIRLPLTLAILDGQLVRVADQTYVIPLVSIVESLQVKAGRLSRVGTETELYRLRDQYIPIVRLYQVFGIEGAVTQLEDGMLVVVEADGQRAGIFVDELLSQQQVVIKSLESNYRRIEGISGATILGDGTVSMITEVAALLRLARSVAEDGGGLRKSRRDATAETVAAA